MAKATRNDTAAGTDVATAAQPKNALAQATGGALADAYADEASSGFENADASAFAIPFLTILQSGSPQCKKSEGEYIKGAEEGFFLNTVTLEVTDPTKTPLRIIPVYYRRVFIKWAPRDSGGGFLGEFLPSDPIVATAVRSEKGDILPDGNYLTDTRVHYVLILNDDGTFSPAVISMASTQVKKSRQWMSRMEGIKFKNGAGQVYTAPMFSHTYLLMTQPEKNDKGAWFGWKIELEKLQEDPQLMAAAKEFKRAIIAGEMKEQMQTQSAPVNEEEVSY